MDNIEAAKIAQDCGFSYNDGIIMGGTLDIKTLYEFAYNKAISDSAKLIGTTDMTAIMAEPNILPYTVSLMTGFQQAILSQRLPK